MGDMTDAEMDAALEAGGLPGTPSEVKAVEAAFEAGKRRRLDEVERLRAMLVGIHGIAWAHREWAITGRCVTALGPGVPGVSAPATDT